MRVALVSKYPPLEGQVSTVNYWLARGLARHGHEVVVVTNSGEADPPFRLWLTDDDVPWLEPSFGSGRVSVLQTEPFGASQFHLPPANPFVTKLTTLALRAIREHGAEILFAHYLEPYAVAAYLASHWTGIPAVVTHSGSDVGRLMQSPALAPVYDEITRRVDLFVGKNALTKHIGNASTPPSPYAPPEEYFNPDAPLLDVNTLLEHAKSYIQAELQWHTAPVDDGIPVIGMYGKLFDVKGIYELIEALGRLRREGLSFTLLLMTRWRRGEDHLRNALRSAGLEDACRLLPFLPNWRVPSFIRACTVVCSLERDWPMQMHVTIVPREVIACGGCLLISEEVRGKAWNPRVLIDGETCIVADDPRDIDTLTRLLRELIIEPSRARRIGEAATRASRRLPTHEAFIDGWEDLLSDTASRREHAAR